MANNGYKVGWQICCKLGGKGVGVKGGGMEGGG